MAATLSVCSWFLKANHQITYFLCLCSDRPWERCVPDGLTSHSRGMRHMHRGTPEHTHGVMHTEEPCNWLPGKVGLWSNAWEHAGAVEVAAERWSQFEFLCLDFGPFKLKFPYVQNKFSSPFALWCWQNPCTVENMALLSRKKCFLFLVLCSRMGYCHDGMYRGNVLTASDIWRFCASAPHTFCENAIALSFIHDALDALRLLQLSQSPGCHEHFLACI